MLQLPTINHLVEPPIPQILPSSQEHQPVAIGELTSPNPRKVGKENIIGASYMSSWVNFSSSYQTLILQAHQEFQGEFLALE